MRASTINGISIEDYRIGGIPNGLVAAEPKTKQAITNGFRDTDIITDSLVFCASLADIENSGVTFKTLDPYNAKITVMGATWGLDGREFTGGDDYLALPHADASQVDFSTGDFSWVARINISDLTGHNCIFSKYGGYKVSGYFVFISSSGYIGIETNTATVGQYASSDTGEVVINTWYTVGQSRVGTVCDTYKNGVDVGLDRATTADMVASGSDFVVGTLDDLSTHPFYGKISFLGIWSKNLSVAEQLHMHTVLVNLPQ